MVSRPSFERWRWALPHPGGWFGGNYQSQPNFWREKEKKSGGGVAAPPPPVPSTAPTEMTPGCGAQDVV